MSHASSSPCRKIALVLVNPPGNAHPQVFEEVLTLYHGVLTDLGHEVAQLENRFRADALNLVFSYQYLPPAMIAQLPRVRYVVMQLEQLSLDAGWFDRKPALFDEFLNLYRNAQAVWDYSQENIEFLARYGVQAKRLPLGAHPRLQRIPHTVKKDVDVLFYGSTHPRRFDLVQELDRHCRVQKIFGQYGAARDAWIARSKVVLNIHAYSEISHLEQVRVFYLLNNRQFVISEAVSWNPYESGLVTYPYADLRDGVLAWLAKTPEERQAVADRGFEQVARWNMVEQVRLALAELPTM